MPQLPFSSVDVEAQLTDALRQVRPSNQFVHSVREKIQTRPVMYVAGRNGNSRTLLLALGGTLSASLLILTVARAVFYLLNRSKA